eukprot:TRINITY_DN40574_c0_g1_i1.p1 TRINITY_DN40574_c0_g1~~TRINITY_DN40574_c0_g1_i1.p1  ORF type:complete len:771 (+),score=134.48 TRINITY_DN40574_c0_g1_i1:97-2409(+)
MPRLVFGGKCDRVRPFPPPMMTEQPRPPPLGKRLIGQSHPQVLAVSKGGQQSPMAPVLGTAKTERLQTPKSHSKPADASLDPTQLDGEPQTDPFGDLISDLVAAHNKLLEEKLVENEELRSRLNDVLTTMWSMKGDSWHGDPRVPEQGSLHLSCTGKSDYIVPEDDILKQQVEKEEEMRFKLRTGWTPIAQFSPSVVPLVVTDMPYKEKTGARWRSDRPSSMFRPSGQRSARMSSKIDIELPVVPTKQWRPSIISSPTSNHRLFWDLAGLVLLVYDMIMIPISLFAPEPTFFLEFMQWFTLIFWTFDVFASLTTGYIDHEGATVMKPFLILVHYLRTWFVPDFVVVGPDWVVAILQLANPEEWGEDDGAGAGASETNLAGLLRVARIIRVLRLLRVAKLKRMLVRIKDQIESEVVFIVFRAGQLVAAMVFLNHLLAGLWYFLGDMSSEANLPSWIDVDGLATKDLAYKYTTSIHWSLSNFALASTKIEPGNAAERFFAIFVLIMGMVMYCSLTAAFTRWAIQLSEVNGETSRQIWLLRRYFRQKSVSVDLSYRILRYVDHTLEKEKETRVERNLTIVSTLSGNLQNELKYVADFGPLHGHPLFLHAESISSTIMHSLVSNGLHLVRYAAEDIIFQRGSLSTQMYLCVEGEITYRKSNLPHDEVVSSGDWLCESSLWVSWVCRGSARVASADAKVIVLDGRAFLEAAKGDEALFASLSGYGDMYVEALNDMDPAKVSDLHRKEDSALKTVAYLRDSVDRFAELTEDSDVEV